MATVKKAGFKGNIIDVIVCVEQIVLGFYETDIGDVLLTGAAVGFPEQLGKMGIAHVAHFRKLLYFKRFTGVSVDVFQNMMKRKVRIVTMAGYGMKLLL